MAHTCPNCGYLCHCSGDIDDIDFGERWDCKCDCEDQEYNDEYEDWDNDDFDFN